MAITANALVEREVYYCVSHLVSELAKAYGEKSPVSEMAEAAFELCCPIPDYEEAAIQAGWSRNAHNGYFIAPIGHETRMADYDDWQGLCEAEDIEPYDREVFEHWIVSEWLADKLAERGEKIDKDFWGLTVWARTTTGQAIASDYVIEQIAADLNKD